MSKLLVLLWFVKLTGSGVLADSLYQKEIQCKKRTALKLLSFREQHVLVQFWFPRFGGKHLQLTTIDQPFGVGVANEQLRIYRKDSEQNVFRLDTDHEENVNPPVRAFMRGLPEWTCDLTNYSKKDFPLLDSAIRCNLHGYLALPVFDSTKGLCVGVLELLMSSDLNDFAYEVEHIHQKLKLRNLTSPQIFDGPALSNSYMGCVYSISSFNTRCFRKVCMSTAIPFYVRDLSTWPFMLASKECHLEMSRGVAGRALSSRGSCFCGDVTKLDEEEYPLVHNARMSRLTSCFAIFLHCVEGNNEYAPSGFELGDGSSIEVVNPPMDLSVNKTNTSGSELIMTDNSDPNYANVTDHWPSTDDSLEEISDNFTVTDLP
ncbi:hypothetical protein E3N88_17261 [Mikania micrantha]|uniref:NLP1-9 GAF domain-containing protein n=1 Tax=Mikania micrantha TaxID=192012 RepID=A0A5N6NTL4_9ASTR|nr:hypothetical protein E3N88_17261 [Mikania micrantha]